MNRVSNKITTLLVGMGVLPLALFAQMPPALKISTSAGQVAIIDSTGTGTVTFSGTCTLATCTTNLGPAVTPGIVVWGGTLGTFSITSATGASKPALGPTPDQDLGVSVITTAAGTLTVQWSDTGFNTPSITDGSLNVHGTVTSGKADMMAYAGYFDSTNTLFGTPASGKVGEIDFSNTSGLFGPSSQSGSV